jgi:uracil-DNA glycosylase
MTAIATKRKLEQSTSTISAFFKPGTKMQKVELSTKPIPFDKKAWIDSLSPINRELLQLEIDTLDTSWLAVIHSELTKPYFLSLKRFLKNEIDKKKVVFPKQQDIYSWSRLTPLTNVKVIILGQDPYHNYNQAHGLAFSVNPPTPPPPSLKNIFKGIQDCYPDFKQPKNGSLTNWAKQGVLLLNACLTVEAHKANSHSDRGWEQFTEKVLEAAVKSRPSGLCVLAWGSPAGKRVDKTSPGNNHLILKSVHPSPLSASRGFFTNKHFIKANEWLLQRYGPGGVIDWALDPSNVISEIQRIKGSGSKTENQVTESNVLVEESMAAETKVKSEAPDSKVLSETDGLEEESETHDNKAEKTGRLKNPDNDGSEPVKVASGSFDETLDEMLEEDIDEEIDIILSQKSQKI